MKKRITRIKYFLAYDERVDGWLATFGLVCAAIVLWIFCKYGAAAVINLIENIK
jgi:hypothetical protein